jgi:hypothetical protein
VSALEGDRDAVMQALGDTIRALDAPDQWRILAATMNALDKAREYPAVYHGQIDGHSATLRMARGYWNVEER